MTTNLAEAVRVRRRYAHRPASDPHGRFWQGYGWSKWYDFPAIVRETPEGQDANSIKGSGIYRFAVPRRRGLVYIGQASEVRRRLAGHARAVNDVRGARVRRHLGFHYALAKHPGDMRVSWIGLGSLDKADRLGIECDLISAHRTIVGSNPDWQFRAFGVDEDFDLDQPD
jgi:hypothetical protein